MTITLRVFSYYISMHKTHVIINEYTAVQDSKINMCKYIDTKLTSTTAPAYLINKLHYTILYIIHLYVSSSSISSDFGD